MIHKQVEVYVDDMIVKAKEREGHLPALRKFSERIRKYKICLNPAKCTFGVTAGKMLGFMITTRGIEVDSSKIKAILEMEPPRSEKDVRSFLGKVQFISWFIAKLTSTCEPIFHLLKKGVPFKWDDKCQKAFEAIRAYLQNPPVLIPPVSGKPLILYLSVTLFSMGCMLAQEGDDGVERAVYYLSKKMVGCEERYTPLEKTCWALVWVSKKLRHYMLTYPVSLVSRMDPLKYLFEKPALTGKMARWLLMLSEFELKYVTRKSIKERVVADFLADYPIEGGEDAEFKLPVEDVMTLVEDVWKLYFDGLLIRNEYEACIVGMEAAIEIGIEKLEVVGDSNLVTFTRVLRLKNQFADALATLASMVEILIGVKLRPIVIEQRDTLVYQHVMVVDEPDDGHRWYYYIWRFVERGEYPTEASKKDKIALKRMAAQYIICGGILYWRSYCGMHKLCIHGAEARRVMKEIHEGVCGPRMKSMMLAKKILRQGYFWSTMETKYVEYVWRCHKCQIHANLTHVPPSKLHQMTSPWPFLVWGIDVIRRIVLAASNGHKFILVAVDYFTKWVEAASYATLTAIQVAHFIKQNVIVGG
ncbi:uncharacterized protein LOC131309494 [Rhododendron vialii]|uniref:uncharacterized protein LOC131309494 n=1 Tax=Rhododendron vialii TaxID=182163 RepID=UPI00265E1CAA|nr:uncharacterized protein LOC131309494 [Rhododendron vialii]